MSSTTIVSLRVELPACSYSFSVQVPEDANVAAVKHQISATCPGNPKTGGQRLVCRGRFLKDDEKVCDIWKTPEESRVVHLAVSTDAWTGEQPRPAQAIANIALPATPLGTPAGSAAPTNRVPPPAYIPLPSPTRTQLAIPTPSRLAAPQSPTFPLGSSSHLPPRAWTYVALRHNVALLALMTNAVDQSTFAMPLQTDPQLTSMLQTIGLHTQSTPLPNGNSARQLSVEALRRLGYEWPSVLDEDYPVRTTGGLDFKKATAHGRPYIQPVDPTVSPTPYQIHALKVLTHTFAILSLTPPHDLSIPTISSARVISPSEIVIAPHVNQVLQQLGLPPVPAHAQGQIGNAQIPIVVGNGGGRGVRGQFPVRQLMAPLLLLLIRTAVLLYFFAPMRKPLVGIMLLGYMVYEIYSAVMRALPQPPRDVPGLQRGAGNQQQPPPAAQPGQAAPNAPAAGGNAAAGGAPAANNRGAQPFGGPGVVARRRNAEGDILGSTLDWIARFHLDSEEQALHHPSPAQPPSPPPNFFQRAFAFVFLFLVTFYPAVWDKRRALLKTREGVVRTETRMRRQPDEEEEPAQPQAQENGTDGEASAEAQQQTEQQATAVAEARTARAAAKAELLAKHNRRANWVKEYIERVMEDEWVDDAD